MQESFHVINNKNIRINKEDKIAIDIEIEGKKEKDLQQAKSEIKDDIDYDGQIEMDLRVPNYIKYVDSVELKQNVIDDAIKNGTYMSEDDFEKQKRDLMVRALRRAS